MDELSAALIIAIAGAAMFAALAFRYLADTVVKLNQELQAILAERRLDEIQRKALQDQIEKLEDDLDACRQKIA